MGVWGLLFLSVVGFSQVLSIERAKELVLQTSPELKQIQNQFESLNAKSKLALAPADPQVQIISNDLTHRYNLGSATSTVYQVTQPLGFPGRALLNYSALSQQKDAFAYQAQSLRLQVLFNLKQAYYQLSLARKNIELNQDQKLSYERILSIAKRRYESGAASQVDFLNAQVQSLQNENDLMDLEAAENTARTQLSNLLHFSGEKDFEVEPIQMIRKPLPDRELSYKKMLAQRPEILSARKQLQSAHSSYKLAWMQLLPDFQLTAGTTFYRTPGAAPTSQVDPTIDHTYMAGVQMNIPLWFLFSERQTILSAKADRAAADANLDSTFVQSKNNLVSTLNTLSALEKKIDNYERHMLPMAEQSLRIALISYSSGKIDFQGLSDTATMRRTLKQNYVSSIVSYYNTYAAYGQLVGEDL